MRRAHPGAVTATHRGGLPARTSRVETLYARRGKRDDFQVVSILETDRLRLSPITVAMVEAVFSGNREHAERAVEAKLPPKWPNRELIERAFTASLDLIRADPARRLWGDRLVLLREGERRVIGSVVFHGGPDDAGVVEIAYGIEEGSQRRGYATEAVRASVDWALAQQGVKAVQATTAVWHSASLRVIERVGMQRVGTRDHDVLGELLVYERAKPSSL